jgi:ferredoxin-NADP reductase/MOSC domain-containing protein YiiM/ferredoxin
VQWHGETVHTAVWKQPIQDKRMVRRLNIDGDGQGDLAGHGGEHRAVMVYQMDSYRYWEHYLGRKDFTYGQFGENFTIEGLPDDEVCIGDRYRIGGALFEITQPRVTCYRVGMRMEEPRMPSLLVKHHRPGFYFRVIEEGMVGAGDEIVKIADGSERVTVAEVDALLYLPGRSRDRLSRALRVPALSAGWKGSLQALLDQDTSGNSQSGNAGLAPSLPSPPAWSGLRSLRVAQVTRESMAVMSFSLEALDGSPLPAALPGQFLVVKLRITPELTILRNYSLSGAPDAGHYRISTKLEVNGAGSGFLHRHIHAGDVLDVSAPRGAFTLVAGSGPVVLLSAGIGATPVLAMLHALASAKTTREVWWLYAARNAGEHPFAQESRSLLQSIARSRRYIAYSRPGPESQLGRDFDAHGHLSVSAFKELGIPQDADFYLCGPAEFLSSFTAALRDWGVAASSIRSEIFGQGESLTPGIEKAAGKPPHQPSGVPGLGPQVSFTRSGLMVPWSERFQNLLELAEACDIPVRWSCRTGVCHTCECSLIGGAVDYEPDPLDLPAQGSLLICCARPQTDIQIDL